MRWARAHRVVLAGVAVLMLVAGCDERPVTVSLAVPGGDSTRGKAAVERYGCGACHAIPGVRGAGGRVGPPLAWMRRQVYIAGILPNTPEHLVHWIMDPPAADRRTAMPDLGVSEADARNIAAYLYEVGR